MFEKNLKDNIYGQDEVIDKIVKIAKRIKLGLKDDNKCSSYLFSGMSGVGKTYLACLFGEYLVGKDNVIRLNMNEYRDGYSINKILGFEGNNNYNSLVEIIRNKPNSVLILDDIDKAHYSIINLFNQIIESSKIKDYKGKDVLFNNVIIIMTTKEGYNLNTIGFDKKSISFKKDGALISLTNCIDDTIMFNPLDIKDIRKISSKKMKNIIDKYRNKGIYIKYSNSLIDEIINRSKYNEVGALKIDKIIRDDVEEFIINEMLNNKVNIMVNTLLCVN